MLSCVWNVVLFQGHAHVDAYGYSVLLTGLEPRCLIEGHHQLIGDGGLSADHLDLAEVTILFDDEGGRGTFHFPSVIAAWKRTRRSGSCSKGMSFAPCPR